MLVRRTQLRAGTSGFTSGTRFEQPIFVVTEHASGIDAPKDPEYSRTLRAARDQVADEVHAVRTRPLNGFEQALELARTAVNVSDEDASLGHGRCLASATGAGKRRMVLQRCQFSLVLKKRSKTRLRG